jgi:hypothetical protein
MGLGVSLVKEKWVSYDKGETWKVEYEELYHANITHNLYAMAHAANIYDVLWRPCRVHPDYVSIDNYDWEMRFEDSVTIYAKDITELIQAGLHRLKTRPGCYKQFDSPNRWGIYEDFIPFVEKYLKACLEYPDAIVRVDR